MQHFTFDITQVQDLPFLLLFFSHCTVFCDAATQPRSWPPLSWVFKVTQNDAPHSVGLIWTSDQLVAETPTSGHTTLTTEKLPCPRRGTNPQSQQVSGRKNYALHCAATGTGHCMFTPIFFLQGEVNIDELLIYVSEFMLETKHETEILRNLTTWNYDTLKCVSFISFFSCPSLISVSPSKWPFDLSFRIERISHLV